jgi:F-type H+-transporting ATPase subunit delta
MSYEAVARRWARAIFDLGKEAGSVARLTDDIAAFAETYGAHAELAAVLDNPLVADTDREAILREVAQRMSLSDLSVASLRLLARKRRLRALPDLARQLRRLADDDQNLLRAEVAAAGPLTDGYLDKLRAEIEKATGKKVSITFRRDPSLIGGVVTKIGDQLIDGSVRARLATFRDSLLRS